MKLTRSLLAIALSFSLVFVSSLTLTIQSVSAQDSKIALQRGYRTGYSDGYMSGYRDAIENATKSYARHSEYRDANRAFNKDYGQLTHYRDGYQQGFESGYDTGFEKRSFDATLPAKISTRGVKEVKEAVQNTTNTVKASTKETVKKVTTPVENNVAKTTTTTNRVVTSPTTTAKRSSTAPYIKTRAEIARSGFSGDEIIIIPADTELVIELDKEINTRNVREGDAFTAKIVSPNEIEGAVIEGRVAKNRRPGRLKRRAELLLSFDRIKLTDARWSNFNALIMEVLPMKGDNVKRIDPEGVVEGTRPYKKDGLTVGGATGTGAVIGAVVGGPVGAAVGAGVGAAFGVGAVVVERGNYIKLRETQQLRIKTVYETQIR